MVGSIKDPAILIFGNQEKAQQAIRGVSMHCNVYGAVDCKLNREIFNSHAAGNCGA